MAFERRGIRIGVPVSSRVVAQLVLVAQLLMTQPLYVALAIGALGLERSVTGAADLLSGATYLSILVLAATSILAVLLLAIPDGLVPRMKLKQQIRSSLASRTVRWIVGWNVGLVLQPLVWILGAQYFWAAALGAPFAVNILLFVMSWRSMSRVARDSRQAALFAGLDADEMANAQETRFRLGAGSDFPRHPDTVVDIQEAQNYAELARKKETNRNHFGFMSRVVAGSFIGAAAIWSFSGPPGPQLWALAAILLAVFIAFLIERRAGFYTVLAVAYDARAVTIRDERKNLTRRLAARGARIRRQGR